MMEWYPRYTALWKADTMHLDPFQEGCYLRLVDHYMETRQPLLDNDAALARIIGISLEQWQTHASAIVRAFFTSEKGGTLRQKRCDLVLKEQDERSSNKSEIGKKGAEARWSKVKENKDIDASAMAEASQRHGVGNATRQDRTGQNRKKEEDSSSPYAFSGSIIRLKKSDYDRWHRAYYKIPDLMAELTSLDDWCVQNDIKKWFNAVSRLLSEKHQKILNTPQAGQTPPQTNPQADWDFSHQVIRDLP